MNTVIIVDVICYFTTVIVKINKVSKIYCPKHVKERSLILTSFFAVTISSLTLRTLSTCFVVLLLRSSNLFLYQESISCRQMKSSFVNMETIGSVVTYFV